MILIVLASLVAVVLAIVAVVIILGTDWSGPRD
jgi:hypothetical protein